MPKPERSYARRSRAGCWTCKRLHKKCDEKAPFCGPCVRAKRHCEGYAVRLVWKQGKDTIASPAGPERTGPVTSNTLEASATEPEAAAATAFEHQDTPSPGLHPCSAGITTPLDDPPTFSSGIGTTWAATAEELSADGTEDGVQAILLKEFQTTGHLKMCRILSESPMESRIVPLSRRSWLVSRVCLAYQAYNTQRYRSRFSHYLEQALDLFKWRLERNQIYEDEMLVTGLLLCSVSISTLLLWTLHLSGLETIITQRGLADHGKNHDSLTEFIVEGIGLLDLPGATLGRRRACQHIWSRLVTPLGARGIEPVTGLPRSLINIMARVDAPEASRDLIAWVPQERAEHVLQYPYWEAFRLMLLLINQDLIRLQQPSDSTTSFAEESPPLMSPDAKTESLVMRILASVKALQNVEIEDPFRIPLQNCILWPLFTAALHTDAISPTRELLAHQFQAFVARRNKLVDRTAWTVLVEVWARRDADVKLHALQVANDFVFDMGVELHLY